MDPRIPRQGFIENQYLPILDKISSLRALRLCGENLILIIGGYSWREKYVC
jgi:hypothetical protein